jgi:hypothetical protein
MEEISPAVIWSNIEGKQACGTNAYGKIRRNLTSK